MAANLVLVLFTLLVAAAVLAIRAYFRAPPALYARRSVPDLIVGNGLILLGLSTVALLGGEIYYRFLHDTTDAFGLARVTQDWMLRHERMNRFGFRDDLEYAPDRAPDKRRVAFVGDSFTAGHGVEDVNLRFANRIRAAHPEWEVHVLANNGLDTGAELDLLRRLAGSRYEFDLVVLVYCLNDVADLLPKWAEVQGRLYSRERPAALVDHSYLLNTFNARRIAASDTGGYYDFVLDGYSGATWEEQQRRLAAMAGLVRDLGGRFALVTFPFLRNTARLIGMLSRSMGTISEK